MSRRSGKIAPVVSGSRLRRKHRDALRAAMARLRERPLAHSFALALLSIALLALLLLKLGLDQFEQLGSPLTGARTLSLFLDPDADEANARALAAELQADARVAIVDAISPVEGLRELAHVDGSREALDALPDNPLPWVLAVEPRDREAGQLLANEWTQRPEIAYLADESDWQHRADTILTAMHTLFLVLAIFIGAAAVLLAANAVRTIRVEGAEERALQRIFGASESDLRRPYVYLGLLYGAIAGAIAVVLALVVALILRPTFAAIVETFNIKVGDTTVSWPWWLICIPAAALLGALGAWLGCRFETDMERVE